MIFKLFLHEFGQKKHFWALFHTDFSPAKHLLDLFTQFLALESNWQLEK